MLALAGNFHFCGSGIAASFATVLFMSGNRA
jgi:ATP-dependent protease ClpP protease subunit